MSLDKSDQSQQNTHFGFQTIATHLKTPRVKEVFNSVAKRYDLMNDLMSFGLHRYWKQLTVKKCFIEPNHSVLDLAGGTGDLSLQIANQLSQSGKLFLTDINHAMLKTAKTRLLNAGIGRQVSLIQGNAESLPFASNFLDRIIIGFGLRNVTYKEKALQEMYRALKPGGKLIILEFSNVKNPLIKQCYDLYSFSILPKLGQWICQDKESYQYLAESIRMHPDQETLKNMMLAAKFDSVEYQNCHQGIVALHTGFKF